MEEQPIDHTHTHSARTSVAVDMRLGSVSFEEDTWPAAYDSPDLAADCWLFDSRRGLSDDEDLAILVRFVMALEVGCSVEPCGQRAKVGSLLEEVRLRWSSLVRLGTFYYRDSQLLP